jgi:hypothetical protein
MEEQLEVNIENYPDLFAIVDEIREKGIISMKDIQTAQYELERIGKESREIAA